MIPSIYKISINKPTGIDPEAGFVFTGKPVTTIQKRGRVRWENLISSLQTVAFIDLVNVVSNQTTVQFDAIVDRGSGSLVGKVGGIDLTGTDLIRALAAASLAAPTKNYIKTSTSHEALMVPRLVSAEDAEDIVNVVPIFLAEPIVAEEPFEPEEPVEPRVGLAGRPANLQYDTELEGSISLTAAFQDLNSDYAIPVSDTPRSFPTVSTYMAQVFAYNPSIDTFEFTNLWIDSQFYILPDNPTTDVFAYDPVADTVNFTVPDTYGAAFGTVVMALVNVKYKDGREQVVLQKITAYGVGMPEEYVKYAQFINILPVEESGFTMIGEERDYPLYNEYTYSVKMFDDDHAYNISTSVGEQINIDLAEVQRYSFDAAGLEYSFTTDLPLNGLQLSQQGYLTGYQQGETGVYNGTVTITLAERVFTYPIKISVV